MQSFSFEQKPIQLITVNSEGKYVLHPDGQNFLKNVPKPIAVVSVAGLYRTGKSYLLNRILLNRNSGFGVGPTINPCTKGLWIWGTPLKGTTTDGKIANVVIIDTEGIGALDEDQNHDTKIFTLAILSSSSFMYNSVGSIDQNALQNLSLVVNLTKSIQLNSAKKSEEDEDDPQELAQYFPSFLWIVRDFTLQLINSEGEQISSKEYLEKALSPQKGFSDDIQEKNRIRRLLSTFFKQRDCVTLIRPTINEQKLQALQKCNFDELRPEFVEQALNLRKRVLTKIKLKTIKGQVLDGRMYLSLMHSYINSINTGGIPNIQNAWTYMCAEKCLKLLEICYQSFEEELKKQFEDNFPCSCESFDSIAKEAFMNSISHFETNEIGEDSKQFLTKLKLQIQTKISQMRRQNQKESSLVLRNYILKNFSVIQKKMKLNEYANFQEFVKSINNFYLNLLDNGPDLPQKELVYLDFLKKVIPQGAQIFIRSIQNSHEKSKILMEEKQKILEDELKLSKQTLNEEISLRKQQIRKMQSENINLSKLNEQKISQAQSLKEHHHNEIIRLQEMQNQKLENLIQTLKTLARQRDQTKQILEKVQMNWSQSRKEHEMQRALLELKLKQCRQEIDSLKMKDQTAQFSINQIKNSHLLEIKELVANYENKAIKSQSELNLMKESISELEESKLKIILQLEETKKRLKIASNKYNEEIKQKNEQYQFLKEEIDNQIAQKIKILTNENNELRENLKIAKKRQEQIQRQSKDLADKTKSMSAEYEKELAILSQKIQFLKQQIQDTKESSSKSIEYYENQIKSIQEMHIQEKNKIQNELSLNLKSELEEKITLLQAQLNLVQMKHAQQKQIQIQEYSKIKFEHNIIQSRLSSEIKIKSDIIKELQDKLSSSLTSIVQKEDKILHQAKIREQQYVKKIKQLEEELQKQIQKASQEQMQHNSHSEESIRQLKNYYELEKEKLEGKLALQREKYNKKYQAQKQDFEERLQEQIRSMQEDYENLKNESMNQVQTLQGVINNLEHQNDIKSKSIDNYERKATEEKQKLEKITADFNLRFDKILQTNNAQKQALYSKISQLQNARGRAEKDLITVNHLKEQLVKDLKERERLLEEKNQEISQFKTTIERINIESRSKMNDMNTQLMDTKINYEKRLALAEQEKQFCMRKLEDNERQIKTTITQHQEKLKRYRSELSEDIKIQEQRKNQEIAVLETKCEKIKKNMKENEFLMSKKIDQLQRQLAIEQEKYVNLHSKIKQFENRKQIDEESLSLEFSTLKNQFAKLKKESSEEIQELKGQIADLESERNQITALYERDKILWDNKNSFLEEIKEKNKKESSQTIKKLELTIESLQKLRMTEKNSYEATHAENLTKIQKRHWANLQEVNQNFAKRQNDYEAIVKKLTAQLRSVAQKLAIQSQAKQDIIVNTDRRVKQLQQSEKRASLQLQKYKYSKQTMNNQSTTMFQREKQTIKSKLLDREEKYKTLEKQKQQLYYDFQKQKAKWNLQKENFSMRNQQLKEVITKNERDLEKLQRENQKLKVERKCNKLSVPNFSRYSYERSNRSGMEDSMSNISLSMSIQKENSNPLGQISFFNNQSE